MTSWHGSGCGSGRPKKLTDLDPDADPGGPKTYGSCGSGSTALLSSSCHLLESNRRTIGTVYVRYDDMHFHTVHTDTRCTVFTVRVPGYYLYDFIISRYFFLFLHSLLITECQWQQTQCCKSLNVLIYICLM